MTGSVDLKKQAVMVTWVVVGTALLLLVMVVVVGLVRGDAIEIDVTGEGGSARISGAAGALGESTSREEVQASQVELEQAAAAAEATVQTSPEAVVATATSVAGTYTNGLGLFYVVNQFGSAVTFTESDGFGFVTAVAEGVLQGDTIVFTYLTAIGTSGTGELTIDGSGSLTGFFSDGFGSRPAALFPAG